MRSLERSQPNCSQSSTCASNMPSESSLQAVKRLGNDLLASRSNINNAPALLSILSNFLNSSSSSASASPECLLEALLSLQAFFVPLFRSGQLSFLVAKKAKEQLQVKTIGTDAENGEQLGAGAPLEAEAIYKTWLWDKYNDFFDILLKLITKAETLPSVQAAGLDALMEFCRQEKQGEFSNRIYGKVCFALVQSTNLNANLLQLLAANYFKYFDICRYTCSNLEKLAIQCHCQGHKDLETILNDDSGPRISLQSLMCNIYNVLACLKSPKATDKDSEIGMESWSKFSGGRYDKDEDQQSEKALNDNSLKKVKLTQKDVKKLRSKVNKMWLTFLRLPLTPLIYKKVLAQLHKIVIPNLSNPILLSDFLTNSYNKGGVISVLALNGLFVLITQHGLEYPGFYDKLYALLEPSIFFATYRTRFFELLDACLKSPHLPSYLAASFAKKLGRMALTSPPAGALIIISIVHNLLRRHPSINCLVHRDSARYIEESNFIAASDRQGTQAVDEKLGADPFIASEPDPANCNALESSLWEIETLRRHYCPAVARFVASLETDLTVRAKTMELAVKDFSSGSYATIFSEEVGRRMKQVPLAFYKSTPTSLFPNTSVNPPEVNFPGWSFGCGQDFLSIKQDDIIKVSDGPDCSASNKISDKRDDIKTKEDGRNHDECEAYVPNKKRKKTH